MKKPLKLDSRVRALISKLPEDPKEVVVEKKPSVRDAILALREPLGSKVFTKRQLLDLVEAAFPELAPVAMSNLDASLSRTKEYHECIRQGEQNIYRFKQG